MEIVEVDTTNRRQVNEYLDLPFRLYANTPQWVPPMEIDARRLLNRKLHPFYHHSQAVFYLAMEGKRTVGRLAVLDNNNYNKFNNENTAFFNLFECEDNPFATQGLFHVAFEWARGRGLDRIIGPKGFTVFDGFGLLTRGFEYRPALGLPYNLPYYPALVESVGFTPIRDLVSGYLDERMQFPEKVHQLSELVQKRRGLHVRRFKSRGELRALVPYLTDLYNNSLAGTEGNTPLTDEDVKGMADQLLWFADPGLIKIVYKGEQPVGFLLAYPDISAALQRTRGRLFPLGWLHLLIELRRTKWINLNGAGMMDGYRGVGGTAILFSEMYKSVSESRYRYADCVQIGTENDNMQREMRDMGIEFYKAHRLYEKKL